MKGDEVVFNRQHDMQEIPYEPNKKRKQRRSSPLLRPEQNKKGAGVSEEQVDEIYQYWVAIMRPGKARVPKLDIERVRKMKWAIADYGVELCKQAIDGCAASDFHMGRNKANKRYDDITLIFRDVEHVEMFLERGEGKKAKGDF
jgi:hypothetical protein